MDITSQVTRQFYGSLGNFLPELRDASSVRVVVLFKSLGRTVKFVTRGV
jgi:hypothetical protein